MTQFPGMGDEWRTAEQPFIYWKIDDKPARALQFTDPGVREKVEARVNLACQ